MCALTKEEWRKGVQRLHVESGGLLTIELLSPEAVASCWVAALSGEYGAWRTLQAVEQTVRRVRKAPHNKPALCCACPRAVRRLGPDIIVGLATPATDTPSSALGFVLCPKCSSAPDVMERTREGLCRIWPALRNVGPITHPTGGSA